MKKYLTLCLIPCLIFLVSCSQMSKHTSNLASSNQKNLYQSKSLTQNDLPEKLVIGYWHEWGPQVNFTSIPQEYNVINVAFARVNPNTATLSISNPSKAQIQTLQNQGKKVILSIGGANDMVPLSSEQNVTNFINSLTNILDIYGYDGVDIDFEGATLYHPQNTLPLMLDAVKQLLEHPSFEGKLFTMAPETYYVFNSLSGPANFYRALILNEGTNYDFKSKISWVQMQYYNSGSMYGTNNNLVYQGTEAFISELTARLINELGLREDQVTVGLLSHSHEGSGYIEAATTKTYMANLLQTFPNLRGLMNWSINYDMLNGYAFANEMSDLFNNPGNTPTSPPNNGNGNNNNGNDNNNGGNDNSGRSF